MFSIRTAAEKATKVREFSSISKFHVFDYKIDASYVPLSFTIKPLHRAFNLFSAI